MEKINLIPVTKPFMPPLKEFTPFLKEIWESQCLTNGGSFHQRLESELAQYLGVEYISLFTNATIALMVALQALQITGEVITKPYSFVATAHSLSWSNVRPVFVDIDSATFNIDPHRILQAITPETTAIMPVHCYGQACDLEKIQEIAEKYNLKVIYDAAHAFGVRHAGKSLLRFGDLSVLSFNATKVFNTFEGGAIISPDAETKQQIDFLKNFGFLNETTVIGLGINGKMNEVQAAFGLLQLRYVDDAIYARSEVDRLYRKGLADISGITLFKPAQNYSYFPMLVTDAYPLTRDELYYCLKEQGILSRRYFYPLISDMLPYKDFPSSSKSRLPTAHRIAEQVLCLPIYPNLLRPAQEAIINIIQEKSNALLHEN